MLAKHLKKKKQTNLVSLCVEMKDFLRADICTFTVQSVTRLFFELFVSVLVPRVRWHPVKPELIPCVVSRGGCCTVNEISVT